MEPELHEDDYVVIHPQVMAHTRDLVAAIINGEATIKQLMKKESQLLLHPRRGT